MINFPYGNANFYDIITNNYFYIDRTDRITLLEEFGKTLLFLRPRRFGKSLLLSILENYYDVAKTAEFDRLFGHLKIGPQPTRLHNQYLILKWNFSIIDAQGDEHNIKQRLFDHLNDQVRAFGRQYQDILSQQIVINPDNGISSFYDLLSVAQMSPYKVYLLIDEYDNFANEVLMSDLPKSQQRYERLVKGEGVLKTIFKAVKNGLEGRGLDRVFITGVSPVVMSDITSGFNIARNIYWLPQFNDLCGFWESEVAEVLTTIGQQCGLSDEQITAALQMMRTFYNGYSFTYDAKPRLYNPTLVLYFLDHFQRDCKYPRRMLDSNLAMDAGKIRYIAQLPHGEPVITQVLNDHDPLVIPELVDRFGLQEMLRQEHDHTFMISLLYYFGVVTLSHERTIYEELILQIPNLVIRKLYVERLHDIMLPLARDMNEANRVARLVYQKGELEPICEFVEQRQFSVFDNRDYQMANELVIKTIFLTLLFNDTFYIMDSEPALERRYADLIMLVRPDMRHSALLDILIEFKFVPLGKNNLTGEQVREMSREAVMALPVVEAEFTAGAKQIAAYRASLEKKYGPGFLKLRSYTVVAVGYDCLLWRAK